VPHAPCRRNVAVITGGASRYRPCRSGAVRRSRNESLPSRIWAPTVSRSANQIASAAPRGAADVMAMTADVSRIEDVSYWNRPCESGSAAPIS